jgi:hypothetical protein
VRSGISPKAGSVESSADRTLASSQYSRGILADMLFRGVTRLAAYTVLALVFAILLVLVVEAWVNLVGISSKVRTGIRSATNFPD